MKQTKKVNNLEGSCLIQKKANGFSDIYNPSVYSDSQMDGLLWVSHKGWNSHRGDIYCSTEANKGSGTQ